MKKFLRPQSLPLLTAMLGILSLLCRIWLQLGGIDQKGLYVTGHIADILSYLLLALAAAGIWLCIRRIRDDWQPAKLFPSSVPGALGCLAAAVGILATCMQDVPAQVDMVWLLRLVTGCVAVVCLLLAGIARRKGNAVNYLIHSGVTLYFLVQLVCLYRTWSSEPQIQEYFFPLLASVFLMLSVYQRANLDAGAGNRRNYCFFNQMALFCCLASLTTQNWFFYLCGAVWTATSLCDMTEKADMPLPDDVTYCITQLEQAGYKAYAVGGCVRDYLLGLTPHDYDLCTNATPDQTAATFAHHPLIRNGEKHGTIGVVVEGNIYEITTFRTEGSYSDSRHPDSVEFVSDLKTDLARRDFTVNAMAYNPKTGIIDPFGGYRDLQGKILRAVGDPETRFTEDALRILRGVRFALRFGLEPEWNTETAMIHLAPALDQLACERIYSELCGILPLLTAKTMQLYQPILTQVIPELKACLGFDQHSRHHAYDVWDHTVFVTEATAPNLALRFAALLHDVGKPVVFYQDEDGSGHFPDHARVGGEMANEILRRLKAPNELREQVVFLISHHMTPFEPDRTLLHRRLSKYGIENCRLLLQLQRADFCSKGVQGEGPDYDTIETMLDSLVQENACLQTKDLAVNGNDLMALGYAPGPQLGQAMQTLLQHVIDETLPNQKEELLEKAKEIMEELQ